MILLLSYGATHDISNNIPDVEFSGYIDYEEQDSGSVTFEAASGLVFVADTVSQEVDISNPEDNVYDFVIRIYLGDGTLLYESDYIAPGESVTGIQLTQTLERGTYKNSVMAYVFCDGEHTEISQCELPIEIKVIG